MQRKMILSASLVALMGAATLAQAGAFGFQAFEEIEVKRNDGFEVEGWLDDEWRAEVRFSLASGESLKEERKRLADGPTGMSEAEVRAAMALAVAEGLAEFEEIQVDRDGRIDIEGYDADGRELEVKSRDGAVLEVERD